jgi:hypothetical protein
MDPVTGVTAPKFSERGRRAVDASMLGLLALLALALGIALQPLAIDDAYITYRFAQNLATGTGFTYNAGRPVLSTTAPLYALILAAGALAWPDIPSLANALSALALWAGAVLLFVLGCREKTPWVGALAALLYVLWPLLWLSLGLETAVLLALALGSILAHRGRRLYWTAILLALASLVRGDGLILTAVIAADFVLGWLWHQRKLNVDARRANDVKAASAGEAISLRTVLGAIATYVVVLLPLLGWLTWQFGSPLPATLGAKVAQSELGVTGFYAHTTFLQGLGILAQARLAQSPLYLLLIPAILAGLVAMWKHGQWVRLVVAWGAAQLMGYTLLGVTPYYWYYAPLVPALVCAAALGLVESVRWGVKRWGNWASGIGILWAAALVLALVWSDLAIVRALDGPVPPPDDPVSKVLPEAKVDAYEQAGHWLRENTPADAVVGVTEVGVMGYHARRPMIDFLGLLEPDVAEALARGDLYWALLRYQPDYLALTAVAPLYAYDVRADPWFRAAYAPVETIDDMRFWAAPLTIYRRQVPRTELVEPAAGDLPQQAKRLEADFGGQIRLLGAVTGAKSVQPGDILALTLYWQALDAVDRDYTVFVHLLGQHDRVLAQRDAPPGLGARPTGEWMPGEVMADPYLLALPEATYAPDEAVWEVGLYDRGSGLRLPTSSGGDNVRFGRVSVLPGGEPLQLDFGAVVLTGYELDRLALSPGERLQVALDWAGEGAARVMVQLVGEAGNVGAQVSGDVGQAVYSLMLGPDAAPGVYDLEVLVTDPASGQILPLLGADGQPQGDRARLTKVRLYP